MRVLNRSRLALAAAVLTALAATLVAAAPPSGARAVSPPVQVYALPPSGTVTVLGHGLGHGHGMSQYGARGAAMAGLTAAQIIHFYYPHTTLTTLPTRTIRVLISSAGSYTTVQPAAGMSVIGADGRPIGGVPNPLPTTGLDEYRLAPSLTGSGLRLLSHGKLWQVVADHLPAQADFSSTGGTVRLYLSDGTSTVYRGTVGGVRQGGSQLTINRLSVDQYTEGVVPREMPSGWDPAAVQAQAIAARSYGVFESENSGNLPYDLCDFDQCQVYGGMAHYNSAGGLLWTDDPASLDGNSNTVLQYGGRTIFAQFSASDGGWTVDGGQPYLIAQADPYDNAASGDPYRNWTRTVTASSIAGAFGLARATAVGITQRDGGGQWGGRVLAGYVDGVDSSGHHERVTVSGFGLQDALGLPHNWFSFAGGVPGLPLSATAVSGDAGGYVSWQPPAKPGAGPITGYSIAWGGKAQTVPATARTFRVGPTVNGRRTLVTVRALNALGSSAAAPVYLTSRAAPQLITPLVPKPLFDSRSTGAKIKAGQTYRARLTGAGDVPATGATAVQFTLTIVQPTASGTLRIRGWGDRYAASSAIVYTAGRTTTLTLSMPVTQSPLVYFQPSAGSMDLLGAQVSYSSPSGSRLVPVAPVRLPAYSTIPSGGVAFSVDGVPGVDTSTTAVALQVVADSPGVNGWLRFMPEGELDQPVQQVAVSKGSPNSNLVLVRIGGDGMILVHASRPDIRVSMTLVAVVTPSNLNSGNPNSGSGSGGRLETVPITPTADIAARGGRAIAAGRIPVRSVVLGTPQLPATGVASVLLTVSVPATTTSGLLYLRASGVPGPLVPLMRLGPGSAGSSTVLVPVSASGSVDVWTSGPVARVSLDALGYVTA
ncbi:MAG: SpoIID/LytB domain-containing protein [Jatrophihabitantaceae bacterium]